MKETLLVADGALWQNSMLSMGVVERWLVADGGFVFEGHAVVEVRIEGALHEVISPVTGRLKIESKGQTVIEPGSLLATIHEDAAAELSP